MTTNRRGFLAGILASTAAPAFCRPTSLMPLCVPKERDILEPWQRDIRAFLDMGSGDKIVVSYVIIPRDPGLKAVWDEEGGFLVPRQFSQVVVDIVTDLKSWQPPRGRS